MKTAVEMLFDKIEEIEFIDPAAGQFYQEVMILKDQAKQMEKEQIVDAFRAGGVRYSAGVYPEQYYNETFKSE